MLRRCFTALIIPIAIGAFLVVLTLRGALAEADGTDALIVSRDAFGYLRTFTTNGAFDLDNPLFEDPPDAEFTIEMWDGRESGQEARERVRVQMPAE